MAYGNRSNLAYDSSASAFKLAVLSAFQKD